MKVSLRKANALQTAINDLLKEIEFHSEVLLNEFKDPEQVIEETRNALLTNIERKGKLLGALYSLRKDVGVANATAGIDERLTQVALIEKRLQMYAGLASLNTREDAAVISGKLEKIKKKDGAQPVYGYKDEILSSVLTEADIANFKARVSELKKEKQKLQDEILSINVKTEVELNDVVVTNVLHAEGLL